MNGGMMKLGTFQRGRYWKLENMPAWYFSTSLRRMLPMLPTVVVGTVSSWT